MWDLQGFLLYRSIERRGETDSTTPRDGIREADLIPYADIIRDPRINPEEAKKIAS